ncbi:MAG TPA: hypothetical protein VNN08_12420 [Thermoanaerobaculia bacterium]|nr:hypothetical protein [Thermoanaerobaculia bacterium]
MKSKVAQAARDELQREMLALPLDEQIRLALTLGEEDLRLFAAANGLTRDEALLRMRTERQVGRRFSRCKAGG